MRAFVIADAYRRKAKPIGMLFWDEDPAHEQGRFTLELSMACSEADVPLSLSFCMSAEGRRATCEQSEAWVKTRIVPEERHNITEVLQANGLSAYREVELLAHCRGRSSDDDCFVYEVDLPSRPPSAMVDDLLTSVTRRRRGGEVSYAFVSIPDEYPGTAETLEGESAAKRAGALVRKRRKEAGLTQEQLAARAGISQAVLSRLESGAGNPTLALLEEMAAALDATLDLALTPAFMTGGEPAGSLRETHRR